MAARRWGTGLKRGDRMICLRLYPTRKDAEEYLEADHADADKLDPTTWFDTPITFRAKSGAAVVAILETPAVRRHLEVKR